MKNAKKFDDAVAKLIRTSTSRTDMLGVRTLLCAMSSKQLALLERASRTRRKVVDEAAKRHAAAITAAKTTGVAPTKFAAKNDVSTATIEDEKRVRKACEKLKAAPAKPRVVAAGEK